MSMPNSFEMGRAIGGNIGGAISGAAESSALDKILQQAMQSNDPNVQNDVMREILTNVSPERRPVALQILQNRAQQMQQQRQRQAYAERGLNPDLPESVNREIIKQQGLGKKQQLATEENTAKADQEQKEWEAIFSALDENIDYTGAAIPFTKSALQHIPWSKAARQREFFDVMAFQLERYARAAHTKGALSTKVYESLLSKLPNSKLTMNQNRGRIDAWRQSLMKNKDIPENLNELTEKKRSLEEIFG